MPSALTIALICAIPVAFALGYVCAALMAAAREGDAR